MLHRIQQKEAGNPVVPPRYGAAHAMDLPVEPADVANGK